MPEHPHIEAIREVIALPDGTFAIAVTIPGSKPTKVTGFDTREKAEAWIERHEANIATGTLNAGPRSWARRGRSS
jgi:hypothetical protein